MSIAGASCLHFPPFDTVDEIHFAPPKKPWFLMIPVYMPMHNGFPWFPSCAGFRPSTVAFKITFWPNSIHVGSLAKNNITPAPNDYLFSHVQHPKSCPEAVVGECW